MTLTKLIGAGLVGAYALLVLIFLAWCVFGSDKATERRRLWKWWPSFRKTRRDRRRDHDSWHHH